MSLPGLQFFVHGIISLWLRLTSALLLCFPRKSSKADLPPTLLPTFHLTAPITSQPTPDESIIHNAEPDPKTKASGTYSSISLPWTHVLFVIPKGTWEHDKSNFIRNPSLRRATPSSSDRKPEHHKKRARIFSKGYGGVVKPIPLVHSSPQLGAREWASLCSKSAESNAVVSLRGTPGRALSSSPSGLSDISGSSSRPVSVTITSLEPQADISASDIVVISPSRSGAIACSSGPSDDQPRVNGNNLASRKKTLLDIGPPFMADPFSLLLSRNSYTPNPLSAVSGELWDAAPAVVLRSVAVPQLIDSPPRKYETRVPYSSLLDYSINNNCRDSRFSDILVSSRSTSSGEEDARSFILSASMGRFASTDFNPLGLSAAPSVTLLQKDSSVSPPKSPSVPTPIIGKNTRLFNSTVRTHARDDGAAQVVEDEELSSFECTEEEFLNLFISCA